MKSVFSRAAATAIVSTTLLAGVTLPVTSTHAQVRFAFSTASGKGAMNPIARTSFKDYARLLALSEDQTQSATELFDAYRAALKIASDEHEAAMQTISENMQESGDFQASMKEMQEQTGTFAEKSGKLESSFMGDLKAILTDKQAEKWPAIERHRRRETSLRQSFYSGAGIDLIAVVSKLKTDPGTPEFAALLEQYEVEMDRRLQDSSRQMQDAASDSKKNDPMDFAAQQEMMKKMGESSKTIRDLNRDYAKRLAAMMSPEQKSAFESEFNKRSFPDVYRESHTEQCLKAAAAMPDLDTTQKEAISNLLSTYQRDAQPLNEAWAKALNDAEEDAGGSLLMEMSKWSGGGQSKDLKDTRVARKELDTRSRARLDELLTPSQRDKLPAKKPSEDGHGGIRIRMGGPGAVTDEESED